MLLYEEMLRVFRVAICDDEESFLDYEESCIKEYMSAISMPCTVFRFVSGGALLSSLNGVATYDLIILDVELLDDNGLNIARCIREVDENVPIAFVSAYITYSPSGYSVKAIRYIIKNMNNLQSYLDECLDCVLHSMNKGDLQYEYDFTIGKRAIKLNDVLYIESRKNYSEFITVHKTSERLMIRKPLYEITKQLAYQDFVSISSKQTANLNHITMVYRYGALLDNGVELTISQGKYNDAYKGFVLFTGRQL